MIPPSDTPGTLEHLKGRLHIASAGDVSDVQALMALCSDALDTIERLSHELTAARAEVAEEKRLHEASNMLRNYLRSRLAATTARLEKQA